MTSGLILPFDGVAPTIAEDVFVAPGAVIIGDVHIGPGSSIWFGAILRGDFHPIRLGTNVCVQDNAVLHGACVLGDGVTVGHLALVHSARLGDGVVVGAKAAIFDSSEIGAGSVVALGALIPPGTKVPERSLMIGNPARSLRQVTDEEYAANAAKNEKYRQTAMAYRLAIV